jgi:hypothetical protein
MLLLIGIVPFIILFYLWIIYFRKIIKAGLEYVGDSYKELRISLKPQERVRVKISGKCAMIVNSPTGWATIKIKNTYQKIFKIRLFNSNEEYIEILNESKYYILNVIIRCSEICEKI